MNIEIKIPDMKPDKKENHKFDFLIDEVKRLRKVTEDQAKDKEYKNRLKALEDSQNKMLFLMRNKPEKIVVEGGFDAKAMKSILKSFIPEQKPVVIHNEVDMASMKDMMKSMMSSMSKSNHKNSNGMDSKMMDSKMMNSMMKSLAKNMPPVVIQMDRGKQIVPYPA